MSKDLILTLDAGTTGLKCTVFTPQGRALRMAVSPYDVELPHPGWAQQPALWFIGAAIDGASQVLADGLAERIAVIGLSGTMNGCIPVDGKGEALHANIIHSDTRAAPQLAQIRAVIDDQTYYAHTGNRLDMHYTLPKILWLREHHPDVYRRTRWFVNTKDVLYGWLTGRHGMTDFSDATLTGALNIHTAAWDDDLLRSLGIDPAMMPTVLPSHDVNGTLTREASLALGLPEGLPVAIGAGDGVSATHGAGLHLPGSAYINIGSSAWLSTLTDKPVLDSQMRYFHILDMDGKRCNICATVQCGAAALDWAIENLLFENRGLTQEAFQEAEDLVDTTPAGAEGVFFLPTFMGERTPWWDANARGTLVGMSLYHGRGHIARAVYEGVAQALHLCDTAVRENNVKYEGISLVGGGVQSNIWPQMIADMFGVPTRVHVKPRQATSLGAAMAAGVGVGIFGSYEEASHMAGFEEDYMPDPVREAVYRRHYEVYSGLYGQMKDAYQAIGQYQAELER